MGRKLQDRDEFHDRPWAAPPEHPSRPFPKPPTHVPLPEEAVRLGAELGARMRAFFAGSNAAKAPYRTPQDGERRTPLHWAAARGHAKCAEALLAAGADAARVDASGRSAAALARALGHDALAFRIERGPPLEDEKKVYQGLGALSLH